MSSSSSADESVTRESFEVSTSDEEMAAFQPVPVVAPSQAPRPTGPSSFSIEVAPSLPQPKQLQTSNREPFGNNGSGTVPAAKRDSNHVARRTVSFINTEILEESESDNEQHPTDAMDALESMNAPIRSKTVLRLPEKLRNIGDNIQMLSSVELLHISDMVSAKANKETRAVSKYSNDLWYVPEIINVPNDQPQFGFEGSVFKGCSVTIFGKKIRVRVVSYLIRAGFLALLWLTVWTSSIPKEWSYVKGYILDPFLAFIVSTIVGSIVCRLFNLPVISGILWASIIWANIPEFQYFTSNVLPQIKTIAFRSALVVIMTRTGLSLNIRTFLPMWKNIVVASSASFFEAIIHALLAQYYLGYGDWRWSFAQGMISSSPTAAVALPSILLLQAEGYGKTRGPVPFMVNTLFLEYSSALWVSVFLVSLITGKRSNILIAELIPVQLFGGAIVGLICGLLVHFCVLMIRNEAERLPTGKYSFKHLKRIRRAALAATLVIGHGIAFLSYDNDILCDGVVAVITMNAFISNFWMKGDEPEWLELRLGLIASMSQVWDSVSLPAFFAMGGTNLSLKRIFDATVFPKGLLILVVSSIARILYVGLSPFGLGLNWRERLFMMVTSLSKSTVQMALASAPLDFFTKKLSGIDGASNPEAYDEALGLRDRAIVFQSVIMLFALFPAPLVAVWVKYFGPVALQKD